VDGQGITSRYDAASHSVTFVIPGGAHGWSAQIDY